MDYFRKKREDFGYIWKNLSFSEKERLEGTTGKFRDFISEKCCLEGTTENFEKKYGTTGKMACTIERSPPANNERCVIY